MTKQPIAKHILNALSALCNDIAIVNIKLATPKVITIYKIKYRKEKMRQSTLLLLISKIFAVIFVSGEKSIAMKPGITVSKNIITNINGTFTYSLPFGPIIIITPVIAVISPPINSSFVPSNISEIFSTVIFILPLFTIGKF